MTKSTASAEGGAMPAAISTRRDFLHVSGRSAVGAAAAGLIAGLAAPNAVAAPAEPETAISKLWPEWERLLAAGREWDRRNNAVGDDVIAAQPPHPSILSLRPQGDMFDSARQTMREALESLGEGSRWRWSFLDPETGRTTVEESVSRVWLRNMAAGPHQSSATARWARACEGELARWEHTRDEVSARLGEPEIEEQNIKAWRDFTAMSHDILAMPAETLGDVRRKAGIVANGEVELLFAFDNTEHLVDALADDLLRLIPAAHGAVA